MLMMILSLVLLDHLIGPRPKPSCSLFTPLSAYPTFLHYATSRFSLHTRSSTIIPKDEIPILRFQIPVLRIIGPCPNYNHTFLTLSLSFSLFLFTIIYNLEHFSLLNSKKKKNFFFRKSIFLRYSTASGF